MAVLERDTLGVREVRLFGAAVRWADAEAQRQQLQPTPENKRRVLGKALSLIRFPLMTIEEFAAGNFHQILDASLPCCRFINCNQSICIVGIIIVMKQNFMNAFLKWI